jgi:hypothetical protein
MRTVKIKIKSASPYSGNRMLDDQKASGETWDDYEKRCWRQRLNVDGDGNVIIPPMAFARAIQTAAARFAGKIRGKGNATWTKHFDAGILVTDPLTLPIKRDAVDCEWISVPADGKPGGSTRVQKCFPLIREWGGEFIVYVLDDEITQDIFNRVADLAFKLVGIGRFRPERKGFYGRAEVVSITWN